MVIGRRLAPPAGNFLTVDDIFRDAFSVAHRFVGGYVARSRETVRVGNSRYGASEEKPKKYVLAQE